jgi:hypothetical protein
MGKKLWTYKSNTTDNYCEVHMDFKEEFAYIKYFNVDNGKMKKEEFRAHTVRYASDAAENWAAGIKKVEGIK